MVERRSPLYRVLGHSTERGIPIVDLAHIFETRMTMTRGPGRWKYRYKIRSSRRPVLQLLNPLFPFTHNGGRPQHEARLQGDPYRSVVLQHRRPSAYIVAGFPEPEKTTGTDTSGTIDLENVALDGGFLVKTLVLSIDPYMRHRMREPDVPSFAVRFVCASRIVHADRSCSRRSFEANREFIRTSRERRGLTLPQAGQLWSGCGRPLGEPGHQGRPANLWLVQCASANVRIIASR
jgi:hypothetical protein